MRQKILKFLEIGWLSLLFLFVSFPFGGRRVAAVHPRLDNRTPSCGPSVSANHRNFPPSSRLGSPQKIAQTEFQPVPSSEFVMLPPRLFARTITPRGFHFSGTFYFLPACFPVKFLCPRSFVWTDSQPSADVSTIAEECSKQVINYSLVLIGRSA